jgi:hypothetical protein
MSAVMPQKNRDVSKNCCEEMGNAKCESRRLDDEGAKLASRDFFIT